MRGDGSVFVNHWETPVEIVVEGDANVPTAVHMAVKNMAVGCV